MRYGRVSQSQNFLVGAAAPSSNHKFGGGHWNKAVLLSSTKLAQWQVQLTLIGPSERLSYLSCKRKITMCMPLSMCVCVCMCTCTRRCVYVLVCRCLYACVCVRVHEYVFGVFAVRVSCLWAESILPWATLALGDECLLV